MNLEISFLELKGFKRAFYYFVGFNVIIAILSISLVALLGSSVPGKGIFINNTWPILFLLVLSSYVFTWMSKRELGSILKIIDTKEQYSKYERYYKRKLICNSISIVLSGLFFLLTQKNLFFYILIIQSVLSLAFYPTRRLITKELNDTEINFLS